MIVILGTASKDQAKTVRWAARKHGFHVVTLKPYSEAYIKRNKIANTPEARRKAMWVSPSDHHPNAGAHTVYADAIIDEMKKMGLIGEGETGRTKDSLQIETGSPVDTLP